MLSGSWSRTVVALWFLWAGFEPGALAQSALWDRVGPSPPSWTDTTNYPSKFDAGRDVNGDGVPDVFVGAPVWGTSAVGLGQAYVYSGADGTTLHTLTGQVGSSFVGGACLLVGDLDADGLSEFATNSYGATVVVYTGADASVHLTVSVPASWPCPGWTPYATMDKNGDGTTDLVLACPLGSGGGFPGAGGVAVVSGTDGSALGVWTSSLPYPSYSRFGWSLANVGDLDADGTADLIVGAPSFVNPNNFFESALSYAQVLSGGSGATIFTLYPNPPVITQNKRFGSSVAGGDFDGDGVPELIVSRRVSGGPTPPGHSVFDGATGTLLYETADGSGGSVVRFLGDVDGDGFGDYLGGVESGDPSTMINCAVLGGVVSCGRADIFSGADGTVISTLRRSGSASLGSYAAAAGDVDGDDYPDVVVSDEFWPPGTLTYLGRVTMFTLRPEGVQVFGSGCTGSLAGTPRIGVRGSPAIGEPVKVNLSKAGAGAIAVLLLGLSDSVWGPLSLPFDASGVGMPGCSLLVSIDLAFPVVTQASSPVPGRASITFPVPLDPQLVGAQLFGQWFVLGPGPGFSGSSLTRGVGLVIG